VSEEVHICPHCGASLKGEYIDQDLIDDGKYADLCKICGDKNHWRLETALVDSSTGETVGMVCNSCRKGWDFKIGLFQQS
jgi:hypothetical protein